MNYRYCLAPGIRLMETKKVLFCQDFSTLEEAIRLVKVLYELSGQESINDLLFLLHEENKSEVQKTGKPKLVVKCVET